MPAKAIKKTVEVVDHTIPREIFGRLSYPAGSDYDSMCDLIADIQDDLTRVDKHTFSVRPNQNEKFEHLLECYQHRKDVRIGRVQIQRLGYLSGETVEYEKLTDRSMRILVVIPENERPRVGLTWVFQGRKIPIMLTNACLVALPTPVSEVSISSGDTLLCGKVRVKASKAIVVVVVADVVRDTPTYDFSDKVVSAVVKDGDVDKFGEKMDNAVAKGRIPQAKMDEMMNAIANMGEQKSADESAPAAAAESG